MPEDTAPPPPPIPSPWDTWTIEQFRSDPVAVRELRELLNSDTGKKLMAVLRGANPLVSLVTRDATSPALIRTAAKAESDCSPNLLGRATEYTAIMALLQSLSVPRRTEPAKTRRGNRDIPPASAAM